MSLTQNSNLMQLYSVEKEGFHESQKAWQQKEKTWQLREETWENERVAFYEERSAWDKRVESQIAEIKNIYEEEKQIWMKKQTSDRDRYEERIQNIHEEYILQYRQFLK